MNKVKKLNKFRNVLLIIIIALSFLVLIKCYSASTNESERLAVENKQLISINEDIKVEKQYLETQNKELHRYKEIYDGLTTINIHTDTRYYDIPLTTWQQEFVQYEAEKRGFGETFIYGLQRYESYFGDKEDSGVSQGVMQIHKKYAWRCAELAELETYDIFDFKDNVKMGIAYLAYLRDSYISEGITSQEELTYLTLLAYNRGLDGAKKYIKENGTIISDYAQIVLKYKYEIEQTLKEGGNN